ncbi:MAG: indole-3-glycerol phosphate synthase TrpC [Bacteroidales bacterium]|nr:indole-3-glycerol phosphate synthase TrpC [Bacteroidales bacterium]
MNILDKIAAVKREEVKRRKVTAPVSILEKSAFFNARVPSFYEALSRPEPSVIGEFKRKSPSRGDINPAAEAAMVAKGYQDAGIAAISVLTDTEFFGGYSSDLQDVAGLVKIPVLRKDFIVDEYQVIEARSIGAGAILLIASILSKIEVERLSALAIDLGMDVLFEIHDLTDLDQLSKNISIIGVNNRNLKTFEVSIDNSMDLLNYLPKDCLKVAESGFTTAEDVKQLYKKGYDAFLIGENFMKSDDPGKAASHFISDLKSDTK